jgi:L-threonylcarbamoyladenylate synthase
MQALGSIRTASTPPTEIEMKAASVPRVSGSLVSHYAPVTPLHLLSHAELLKVAHATLQTDPTARVACIVFSSLGPCAGIKEILVADDAVAYAHDLYARLHDLDAQGFVKILIERPPDTPAWEAVTDRLSRAAKR